MDHLNLACALSDEQSEGLVGESPWTAEHPIVLDISRAQALGWVPVTTYVDAIPSLVDAARSEVDDKDWREVYPGLAAYPLDLFDYAAEDSFVADLLPDAM